MKPVSCLLTALLFSLQSFSQAADSTLNMDTVLVKAQRPAIENRADKTILHLEGSATTAGMNAFEVLRNAPGVMIDAQERIMLGGKSGVTVYIDGRPSNLSGNEVAQVLKSMDASTIRNIEIISNPSSRYEAAGTAGIINIRLKRSVSEGVNGSMSGSFVQSNHARGTAAANINARRGRTNAFGNFSWNRGLQYVRADNDRVISNGSIIQRAIEKDVFGGGTVRTGVDISLRKNRTLGFLYQYHRKYSNMDNRSSSMFDSGGKTDSSIITRSIAPFATGRHSFNVNYAAGNDTSGINIDADVTHYRSSIDNELQNNWLNGGGQQYRDSSALFDQATRIRIVSVKADYHRIVDKWKLETGARLAESGTDNQLLISQRSAGTWKSDSLRTNFYSFDESVAAAYGSLSRQYEKVQLQFGLRAEYSDVKGRSTDLHGKAIIGPDTNYLNLFPSLFLQYSPAKLHAINFSASRRIDRPGYSDQNPFVYVLDALNSEAGNAALRPQFTSVASLSYTYKWASTIKIQFSNTQQYIEQLTYVSGKGTVMMPQNAGTRRMLNLVISTPLKPAAWWNIYGYAEPFYQQFRLKAPGFKNSKSGSWGFNGYAGNNFILPKGWKLELNGWFNFQNRTTIYTSKPLGSINLGMQKNLLKETMTIRCVLTDLLNTQRWEQSVRTPSLQMLTYRKWESRNMTLALSWRFGKKAVKQNRQRETGREELDRIKERS